MNLITLVAEWDREYEATLPSHATLERRRPYWRLLDAVKGVRAFRFQPYQNDVQPNFIEKLGIWLQQFDATDRRAAFLLAARLIFVTQPQLDALLRRLFRAHLRRHLLDVIIRTRGLAPFDYLTAGKWLDEEMNATIVVPNSDSAPLNAFVRLNGEYFKDRMLRRLVGPELFFWTYASGVAGGSMDPAKVRAARTFDETVVLKDAKLRGKKRLVILEDFSGSGSDLAGSVTAVSKSSLPVEEVCLLPAIATEAALERLDQVLAEIRSYDSRQYFVYTSYKLSHEMRCYGGPRPSYLDDGGPLQPLSEAVRRLSESVYASHFDPELDVANIDGFGGLALAFAMYSNCPDNSLPIVWSSFGGWHPLYPRVSRII